MKTIGRLLTGLLLMANLTLLTALSLHVVRTGSSTEVLMKDHLTLVGTYVDLTKWTAADVTNNPDFERRLKQIGKSDLLVHIAPVHPSTPVPLNAESNATPPGYQAPNPPIVNALTIPTALTIPADKPAPKPVNPLAKPAGSGTQTGSAPKAAGATPSDGSDKNIFNFGQ